MKPADIDRAICEWSMSHGQGFTEKQLLTLVAAVFNQFHADGHIHTMPDDGTHCCHKECWCSPMLSYKDEETGVEQWVHTDTRKEGLN